MSAPLLMLGFFTVHQSRQAALKTESLFNQNSAVSMAAAEMLAKLTKAHFLAGNNDLEGFSAVVSDIDILLKALAWGTDGGVFHIDNNGALWSEWQRRGWYNRIGLVRTSDKIRQYAGEISLFHRGFEKYTRQAIQLRNISAESGIDKADIEKAHKYERLIVERIGNLLDELSHDTRARRQHLQDLQFDVMRASFSLAIAFFLIVVAASWYFSHRDIAKPIHELNLQFEKVRAGDMKAKLPLYSQDEIGQLARSFNRMTDELNKVTVSKDYMNSVLDASPLGLVLADEKGDNVYSNAAFLRILGTTKNIAKGNGWVAFIHPEDRERVMANWNKTLQINAPYDNEQRFVRADGTVVWTRMVVARVGGSKPAGYVLTIDDITEQKKLEGTVRQAEKMSAVGQLAGGIAHDLNNGLTPVIGYLDMLLSEAPKEGQMSMLLGEAKQSTQRCIDVVKKLLNFSRPATQAKSELSADAMLAEVGRLAHTLIPASVTVAIKCDKNVHKIYGNESDLISVLVNLAVNARDAMGGTGTLTIEAKNAVMSKDKGKRLADGVSITITDTGKGIKPEVLPHIFEPFFTTKPKGQGTGLGLAMVYNILKDHAATIDVASVLGRGTTFTLYFPDPKDVPQDIVASTAATGAPASTIFKGSGTILFVDDEESLRNMGRVFLERMGYQVLMAKDGEEAVKVFSERRKDITAVIMDVTMPKMSGLEAMKSIKYQHPSTIVILASGFTSEATTEELIQAGAAAFLPKPYLIGPLADVLHKALK